MGLLDKVKAFAGGKGMAKVTISAIERQPAENATFPVTDSMLKGTMVIEALQPCVLLATKYEVWLYISDDPADETGSPNLVATALDPDPNTSYVDPPFEYPLDMAAGKVVERSWLVADVDLAKALTTNGYSEPHEAIGDKRVRLVVKCIADVKGSPFDPSAEVEIQLVA